MIHLSPRLQMVANLTREGNLLTDIGTDHAYLPAFLIQSGRIPGAIAADVRTGPLANAKETLIKYGLADRVTLVLSDGFASLTPGDSRDFVLAGMGGNLITDLMATTPWIQEVGNHFVLQPQSHPEDLREYLYENGFHILQEQAVEEPHHVYLAMEVEYTGAAQKLPPEQYYIGRLIESESPAKKAYYEGLYRRLKKRKEALERAKQGSEEQALLERIMKELEERVL